MSSDATVLALRAVSKAYRLRGGASATTLAEAWSRRLRGGAARPAPELIWALRDVAFDASAGEVIGLVGRNGAGKSTLFRILSRISEPTAGEVHLWGRVGCLLEVGTGFHPELTGRENIYMNGSILGMRRSEIDRHFDAIVQFAEVERFLDTPVKHYSSGMYVRLAFAVAAHLDADILLVDEVLAVGDAEFQAKCLGKMRDVARSGRTVIFISHNEAAVRQLCDRALVLEQGQVVYDGAVDEALRRYRQHDAEPGAGFSAVRRTHSSPVVEIVQAELAVDGVGTATVPNDHVPELSWTTRSDRPVTFTAEVIVRDETGTPVLYAPIDALLRTEHHAEPGLYRFRHRLRFPTLAAGRYTLDLLLMGPERLSYDCVEQALAFEVPPAALTGAGWTYRQSLGRGCVLLQAESGTPHV